VFSVSKAENERKKMFLLFLKMQTGIKGFKEEEK